MRNVWRSLALSAMSAVAALSMAGTLYTVRESDDTLVSIDTNTLVFTPIGPLGVTYNFGDLAWDSRNGVLYMVDGRGGSFGLYTVNTTTGQATLVGTHGQQEMFGLEYDPTTDTLFGSQSTQAQGFWKFNRSTGAATFIGNPGINLDDLAWVGSTNQLVGSLAGPGSLHDINRNTGSQTLITGGSGFFDNCGTAWDSDQNLMYMIDWSGNFFKWQPGSWTRTTLMSGIGPYDGMAYVSSISSAKVLGSSFSDGVIYDVSKTTGNATNPRSSGINNLCGLTVDAGGTVYSLTTFGGNAPNSLIKIDPNTGAGVVIGPTGLSSIFEGDLDIDPTSDTLYGIQDVPGGSGRMLFKLNKNSGAASVIGDIQSGASDLSAMTFDRAGNLYVLDTAQEFIYKVDKNTAAILSTVLISQPLGAIAGMDIDPASGTCYVVDGNTNGTNRLWKIDLNTGAMSPVGPTTVSDGLSGLVFIGGGASPVTVRPSAFNIFRGSLVSGGLNELFNSDDQYLIVRNGPIAFPSEAPITVSFDGIGPASTATQYKLKIENRVSINGLVQQVDLFNFSTNAYVDLDTVSPAPISDTVRTLTASNPGQMVGAGNLVRARLRVRPGGPLFTNTWRTYVDQVEWTITP